MACKISGGQPSLRNGRIAVYKNRHALLTAYGVAALLIQHSHLFHRNFFLSFEVYERIRRLPADSSFPDFRLRRVLRSSPAPLGDPFHGREQELAKLDAWLRQGGHLIEVNGQAGIGKTQLVIQALDKMPQEMSIWWVNAESDSTVASDMKHLAVRLGIAKNNTPTSVAFDKAKGRLARTSNWTLVLDNFEENQTQLSWIDELHQNGNIVVTTRAAFAIGPSSRPPNEPIELSGLNRSDSVELLKKQSRLFLRN